jgi:hypothetical protein
MATKISKENFRNMGAIQQHNLTSRTILDFYKGWLLEEPIAPEEEPSVADFKPFQPELQIGGEGNVLKLSKELNRNLDNIKSYFQDQRYATSAIMSKNNPNRFFQKYVYVNSHAYPDAAGNLALNPQRGTHNLKKIIDQMGDVAKLNDKDGAYQSMLDGLNNFLADARNQVTIFTAYARIYGTDRNKTIDDFNAARREFRNNLNGYKNGTLEFKFPQITVGGEVRHLLLPEVPQNDPRFLILFMYPRLPSTTRVEDPFPKIFEVYEKYYFRDERYDVKIIPQAVLSEAMKYISNLNVNFSELNSIYRKFSTNVNKVEDSELKDINKELREIDEKMKQLVTENYYAEFMDLYITKLVPIIGIGVVYGPIEQFVKIMRDMQALYNKNYKEYKNDYIELFDRLKTSRNI